MDTAFQAFLDDQDKKRAAGTQPWRFDFGPEPPVNALVVPVAVEENVLEDASTDTPKVKGRGRPAKTIRGRAAAVSNVPHHPGFATPWMPKFGVKELTVGDLLGSDLSAILKNLHINNPNDWHVRSSRRGGESSTLLKQNFGDEVRV